MQNALVEHIKAINAKTAAWVAEDPKNRWAGMLVEDFEHWASQGVTTPEEFEHHTLTIDVYEMHKTVYGFRCDYSALKAMTLAQLQVEMMNLNEAWKRRQEGFRAARIQRKLLKSKGLKTI